MSQSSLRTFIASADVRPCRFVRGSGEFRQAEAAANAVAYGVSGEGTTDAPIPLVTDRFAARAGQALLVYGPGDTCEVEAGAAIDASAGPVYLKPDAQGRAVAATTGQHYSAEAHTSATAAGQRVKCTIIRGVMP